MTNKLPLKAISEADYKATSESLSSVQVTKGELYWSELAGFAYVRKGPGGHFVFFKDGAMDFYTAEMLGRMMVRVRVQ